MTFAGNIGAELKLGSLVGGKIAAKGEIGSQRTNFGLDEPLVAGSTRLKGNIGPASVDENGRGSINLGAGLRGSAGLDVSADINISIPDTIDAAKNFVNDIHDKFK